MNPRSRRLESDRDAMNEAREQGAFEFRGEGDPPETCQVMFDVNGLMVEGGRLKVRRIHRCTVYLHRDYPRRPPVVRWDTPVFHPNLLGPDRNGGVCVGSWNASESLPDLLSRLKRLVAWETFNVLDALDREAAEWATAHAIDEGFDVTSVEGDQVVAMSAEGLVAFK